MLRSRRTAVPIIPIDVSPARSSRLARPTKYPVIGSATIVSVAPSLFTKRAVSSAVTAVNIPTDHPAVLPDSFPAPRIVVSVGMSDSEVGGLACGERPIRLV